MKAINDQQSLKIVICVVSTASKRANVAKISANISTLQHRASRKYLPCHTGRRENIYPVTPGVAKISALSQRASRTRPLDRDFEGAKYQEITDTYPVTPGVAKISTKISTLQHRASRIRPLDGDFEGVKFPEITNTYPVTPGVAHLAFFLMSPH